MPHLALLGDSIFDNAQYVPPGEAVIDHLRARLTTDWQATLIAIDGNITIDIERQLERLPKSTTHLALSIGGNDALSASGILQGDAESAMQVLRELTEVQREFSANYRAAVTAIKKTQLPLIICTIYDSIPGFPTEALTALSFFNDVIVRVAAEARFPLLDLRLFMKDASDYAPISPIEPSARGGAKIAMALIAALRSHDFTRPVAVIYF